MSIDNLAIIFGAAAYVALYWLMPAQLRWAASAAATTALLLAYSPLSLLALLVVTLATWQAGRRALRQPSAALAGVAFLIFAFVAYRLYSREHTLVLLGFAYYSLRLLHYLAEIYKQKLAPHTLTEFLHYSVFAPIVPLGPLERFGDLQRQLRRCRWNPALFSAGLERILIGATKVLIVGNSIQSGIVKQIVIDPRLGFSPAVIELADCLRYGIGLYFQFAGYSDVAIGLAALLGIQIGENFRAPFVKTNIGDFWNAWHITLSSWCRDYVYYPIVALLRWRAAGIVAAMLVLALWHEFSWRYVVWGAYHGLGIVAWRLWQGVRPSALVEGPSWLRISWRMVAWALTFAFVILSFAWTKEPNVQAGAAALKTIFGF